MKFYFTYSLEGHPFEGGWTEVRANDYHDAAEAFREVHPDKYDDTLNCAFVYNEAQFKRLPMYRNGNFGARCHEVITAKRR